MHDAAVSPSLVLLVPCTHSSFSFVYLCSFCCLGVHFLLFSFIRLVTFLVLAWFAFLFQQSKISLLHPPCLVYSILDIFHSFVYTDAILIKSMNVRKEAKKDSLLGTEY